MKSNANSARWSLTGAPSTAPWKWNCAGWPYEDSWSDNQERPENDDPCRRDPDRMHMLALPTSHFESSCLSSDPLFQVTRATAINRILYAGPSWWGLTSAQDRERIERFCRKLERAGCGAEDSVDIDSMMEGADKGLLLAVVRNAEHVLRPR